MDEQDVQEILGVLKSDSISGKSGVVTQYEEELAEFFQTKYAVTCTNGTSAIQMALFVFGVKKGDEVMIPPTAPIMSILPIVARGATPVFVDLESDFNFNLSLEDIKRKCSKRTRVLMNVPMWGYPNNSEKLAEICHDKKIRLLEDLSHCHGSRHSTNKRVGSFGDIAVFSTHERKMITTGEGGFLLTNEDDLYERLVKLRSFGVGVSYEYGEEFGLNYRLGGINAALGRTQLKKLDDKIHTRTKNAQYLLKNLRSITGMHEIDCGEAKSNYYSLVLIFKDILCNQTMNLSEYLNGYGIVSDTYAYRYKPLYEMPLFEKYVLRCPNAEKVIRSIITLPTHEGLKQEDLDYIAETFNNFKFKQT